MYAPGHVGIALALFAPIGFALTVRGRSRLALVGTVGIAGVTLLPDADSWLPWFVHRGSTHSVWFALAVGVALGVIAASIAYYRHRDAPTAVALGAFGVFVGTLAVLAHLLGDVVTPMGVRPFSPLADTSYTLNLVLASDPTANTRLLTLGCLATVAQLMFGTGLAPTGSGRSTDRRALDAVDHDRGGSFRARGESPATARGADHARLPTGFVREPDD